MPDDPAGLLEGDSAPEPSALDIPDDVIAQLRAERDSPDADKSAVARLQFALRAKEGAVRARVRGNQLIALAKAGYTRHQIAKLLGMKPMTVKSCLYRARRDGRLRDLQDMLQHDTSALAVDAINSALRQKDSSVAIEHLKGMGFYKNHSNIKNEGGAGFAMPPLQVNVVVKNEFGAAPTTAETFDVSEQSVGVPREDTAP